MHFARSLMASSPWPFLRQTLISRRKSAPPSVSGDCVSRAVSPYPAAWKQSPVWGQRPDWGPTRSSFEFPQDYPEVSPARVTVLNEELAPAVRVAMGKAINAEARALVGAPSVRALLRSELLSRDRYRSVLRLRPESLRVRTARVHGLIMRSAQVCRQPFIATAFLCAGSCYERRFE